MKCRNYTISKLKKKYCKLLLLRKQFYKKNIHKTKKSVARFYYTNFNDKIFGSGHEHQVHQTFWVHIVLDQLLAMIYHTELKCP